MNNLKKFAEIIKENRIKKSETLAYTASILGVNHSYLSKLENGLRKPSYLTLSKLISHFSLVGMEALELATLAGYSSQVSVSQRFAAGYMVTGENSVPIFQTSDNHSSEKDRGKEVNKTMENNQEPIPQGSEVQVQIPNNTPVLYTDSCFITNSQFGIVMDFAQTLGSTNQQTVVARLGLSVEHAEALVKVLSGKIVEAKMKAKNNKKERVSNNN